jgi:hypothetical protein
MKGGERRRFENEMIYVMSKYNNLLTIRPRTSKTQLVELRDLIDEATSIDLEIQSITRALQKSTERRSYELAAVVGARKQAVDGYRAYLSAGCKLFQLPNGRVN